MLKGFGVSKRYLALHGHFRHFCALLGFVFGFIAWNAHAEPLFSSVNYSVSCGSVGDVSCSFVHFGAAGFANVYRHGVEAGISLLPSATGGAFASARLSYEGGIYARDSDTVLSLLQAHPELAQVGVPVNVQWFASVSGVITDNVKGFELFGTASIAVSYSWTSVITGGTTDSNNIIGGTESVPIPFGDFGITGVVGSFQVSHYAECGIDRFGIPPYNVLLECDSISDPTFSLDQAAFDAQLNALGLDSLRLDDLFAIGYSPGLTDLPDGSQSVDLPGTGTLLLAGMLAFGSLVRKPIPRTRLAST